MKEMKTEVNANECLDQPEERNINIGRLLRVYIHSSRNRRSAFRDYERGTSSISSHVGTHLIRYL